MSAIKSRPTYQPFALDGGGARHLLLVDRAELPAEALAGGPTIPPAPVETWLLAAHSRAVPGRTDHGEAVPTELGFRSILQMLARLERRLQAEHMGFRLYAVGTEDFLWDVHNTGTKAGLGKREIRLTHVGSLRRRVICVHCRAVTENVTSSIVACAGCGARLFVRDHFSTRLAGFQGVQVDAEVPGDVPAAEELYR